MSFCWCLHVASVVSGDSVYYRSDGRDHLDYSIGFLCIFPFAFHRAGMCPYERLEAAMQVPVMPSRPHEDAVVESFRDDPGFALYMLNRSL